MQNSLVGNMENMQEFLGEIEKNVDILRIFTYIIFIAFASKNACKNEVHKVGEPAVLHSKRDIKAMLFCRGVHVQVPLRGAMQKRMALQSSIRLLAASGYLRITREIRS